MYLFVYGTPGRSMHRWRCAFASLVG